MKISIKHFILAFPALIAITMWLPIKLIPLKGVTNLSEKTPLSIKTWFSGRFQTTKEEEASNNFGGRDLAVRIFNQYDYSLYKNIHAKEVVLGKNNMLFEKGYIDSYFGINFEKDKPLVDTCINAATRLQHYLTTQGKQMLIVIAPGKASFFTQHIPSNYQYPLTKNNAYHYTIAKLKESNLNYIDLSAYFQIQKSKHAYPLFTDYGVHWSLYGSAIAFDTVSRYMGAQCKVELPKLSIPTVERTNKCGSDTDCDLLDLINLLIPQKLGNARAIPHIKWDTLQKPKLNVLFVTDSFMWNWVNQNLPQNAFENYYFWFYNHDSWDKKGNFVEVATLDKNEILKKTDIVVFLNNEAQCTNIGCGFAQNFLNNRR
jgi:SGNH hydrolase-like domain, acetyltransferase AlgX